MEQPWYFFPASLRDTAPAGCPPPRPAVPASGDTVSSPCPRSTKDSSSEPPGGSVSATTTSRHSPNSTAAGGIWEVRPVLGHLCTESTCRLYRGRPRLPRRGRSPSTPAPPVGRAGEGRAPRTWWIDLVPAVLVLAAHGRVLVQQQLAAAGVAPDHRSVIQRREAVAVLVIRGCAKLQQGLEKTPTCGHWSHTPFTGVNRSRRKRKVTLPRARVTEPSVPELLLASRN